jgi:hypothetical protein
VQSATPHHHFVSTSTGNEVSDSPSVDTPITAEIEALVKSFLSAEHNLAAAVDAAGGQVALSDGRTVSTGRAEFDAVLGRRRRRAWVVIRKNVSMPPLR